MALNEKLVNQIIKALVHISDVEEKAMFQGLTFMVNGKMCIGVRGADIIFRIDPSMDEVAMERIGCRPMIHGKRRMRGYFFVGEEGMLERRI